ncbi:MAG: hypothetical protein IJL14_04090 [Selenomonadaceae bacterium]|nr:hypothetical protein [Selenomonadaceae bacterium]
METGAGNDSVSVEGENILVKTGDGNNTVLGTATVNLGKGNATVTGNSSKQTYQYDGGNNVITNYSYEDEIQIASGKIDSYSFDGGDLIFHIGSGSLRLKNMTNHAITVKDSSGKTSTQIYSNGYSPQQVIKNLVKAWNETLLNSTPNFARNSKAFKTLSTK